MARTRDHEYVSPSLKMKNIHSVLPCPPGINLARSNHATNIIIRQVKAKQGILKLTSVFHHLPSIGPKQVCALTHLGCTREAGTSYGFIFGSDMFQ